MTTQQSVPRGGMFICRPEPILVSNPGFCQGLTLLSDLHIGARNVDYELIEHELSEAAKEDDRILINGDVFDMILVQDRKRFRADVLHPKLVGRSDLIDAAIEWGVKILSPYVDRIDMIGLGNHEEAVTKYHGTDVLKSLVYELRKRRKNKDHLIHYGGYTGFVDYRFRKKATSDAKAHGWRFVIYYHHGIGGSAPVTKGMIDFSRVGWVQSDVIWFGHRHARLSAAVQSVGCPFAGFEPVVKDIRHVQTGSYFDTYCGQTQESLEENGRITNYAADMRCSPQGKGGARLVLRFNERDGIGVKLIQ